MKANANFLKIKYYVESSMIDVAKMWRNNFHNYYLYSIHRTFQMIKMIKVKVTYILKEDECLRLSVMCKSKFILN